MIKTLRFVTIILASLCFAAGGIFAQAATPSASAKPGTTLTVAAAANISSVGPALSAAYAKAYPGSAVNFVFGASGALTTQIRNGAPFDLFMSADVAFAQNVYDAGLASTKPAVYARGTIILLSRTARDFSKGLALLGDTSITQFAIANPETAPYGNAALQALTRAGLWDSVKAKAVTAQTISQAVQFTLQATGIGFVNKSALYTDEVKAYDKEGVFWTAIDQGLYDPIDQAFVVLKSAKSDAAKFVAFLLSAQAKAIFAANGYSVP